MWTVGVLLLGLLLLVGWIVFQIVDDAEEREE
jgi:hypothetical protein